MPIDSLQLAPRVALATTRRRSRSRRACAVAAVLVASLAGFGLGFASIAAAVIAAATIVLLCLAATRSGVARRSLAWNTRRRARARRESMRRDALCQAKPSRRTQYFELRELVESIERSDPLEARRLYVDSVVG